MSIMRNDIATSHMRNIYIYTILVVHEIQPDISYKWLHPAGKKEKKRVDAGEAATEAL